MAPVMKKVQMHSDNRRLINGYQIHVMLGVVIVIMKLHKFLKGI